MFAKGLAFGFVRTVTVNPMWVLCFRRIVTSDAFAGVALGPFAHRV